MKLSSVPSVMCMLMLNAQYKTSVVPSCDHGTAEQAGTADNGEKQTQR